MLVLLTLRMLAATVPIDEPLWQRIDAINAALKSAGKPAAAKVIAEQLAAADALLREPAFDADYQAIRAGAFATDFTQAEAMTKRAAPAFVIAFDGDSDTHFVAFKYLFGLAAPGSEAREFFRAYVDFPADLFVLNKGWTYACLVELDIIAGAGARKLATASKAKLAEAWRARALKWKEPFFREAAERAARCLSAG